MPNTREKLIELANDVLRCLPWGEIQKDTAERIADRMLANGVTISNLETVNKEWISVKDGLPDVGCDVLILYENKSYGVGAYSDTYRDFFSGQFPVKGVTHWMPLPEPPKEDHDG